MLGDLWHFLAAVVSHWVVLVTGSVLTALVFVAERWRPLPRGPIVIAFVWVFLGWAAFLTWRDERQRLDELEVRTSDAQPLTLDQEERLTRVLQEGRGLSVLLGVHTRDSRGREFAKRVRSAFQKSGWGVGGGGVDSSGSGRSLRILAEDPNTRAVSLVMTAFNEARLRYRVFRVCQGTPLAVEFGESEQEAGRPTMR